MVISPLNHIVPATTIIIVPSIKTTLSQHRKPIESSQAPQKTGLGEVTNILFSLMTDYHIVYRLSMSPHLFFSWRFALNEYGDRDVVVRVFFLPSTHTQKHTKMLMERRGLYSGQSSIYILNTKYQIFFKWSSQPTKVVSVHYIAVRRTCNRQVN